MTLSRSLFDLFFIYFYKFQNLLKSQLEIILKLERIILERLFSKFRAGQFFVSSFLDSNKHFMGPIISTFHQILKLLVFFSFAVN